MRIIRTITDLADTNSSKAVVLNFDQLDDLTDVFAYELAKFHNNVLDETAEVSSFDVSGYTILTIDHVGLTPVGQMRFKIQYMLCNEEPS